MTSPPATPHPDHLGPYEILGLLGQGGMGSVYRARDPRLDRTVAIKVLLDDAAGDPSRRERFLLEARAVAALTHPNIVTIHSVEEDAGRIFLTMEYVEGRTLADVIEKSGMPLDRLLALAIPLADAVAAAHQKGIVHRDLKPANVMVSTDGRVKVLDFGLAKLREPASPDGDSVTKFSPAPVTADGVILGTMAYMAPEQAEGRPADHRADVFSIGVILYEMATGRRPFTGDTTAALLAAILRDMPVPVTEVNAALPAEFARIVRRALAKDPTRRYQTALDVRNELEDLKREIDAGRSGGIRISGEAPPAVGLSTNPPASWPATPPALVPLSSGQASAAPRGASPAATARRWIVPVSAAIGITVLAIGAYVWRTAPVGAPPDSAPPKFIERQVTSNPPESPVWYAAVSPDGKYAAYGDFSGIHLRLIDTGETRTIPVPEGICFT